MGIPESALWQKNEGSKVAAKERLRLVLVHDRTTVSPCLLETLKEELLDVISKYMEIDQAGFEVNIEQGDDSMALVANIPIKEMKRALSRTKN